MLLNDAEVKKLISNIGYQQGNVSVSSACFLCSDKKNDQLNCHLFHASGLTIADNSPISLPHQNDLVDWISRRFATPESVHCAINTLFLLATSMEEKVNRDNHVPENNINPNSDANSSSKAWSSIVLYAIHLLDNKSINLSILEGLKKNAGKLNEIQSEYIKRLDVNRTKCQDDERTFSTLVTSIFQAICRWITQPTISKELEHILITVIIPNLVAVKGRTLHQLYIKGLPEIFSGNIIKISESLWPNWEKMDHRLFIRRTITISQSEDLTEKLLSWQEDPKLKKEFLIKGIRSLSLASQFM